jgi:hypothetical protein
VSGEFPFFDAQMPSVFDMHTSLGLLYVDKAWKTKTSLNFNDVLLGSLNVDELESVYIHHSHVRSNLFGSVVYRQRTKSV